MATVELISRDLKTSGSSIVACFPLYPPLELIHAMGLNPVVLWGIRDKVRNTLEADKHIQNYSCGIARQAIEFLLSINKKKLDGILYYNACDTLRNIPEVIEKGLQEQGIFTVFSGYHIPQRGLSQIYTKQYLQNEMNQLITTLEIMSGKSFSFKIFKKSVEQFRKIRTVTKEIQQKVMKGIISFQDYALTMQTNYFRPVEKQLNRLQTLNQKTGQGGLFNNNAGKILLTGILPPPFQVMDILNDAGLVVVRDDIASLNRSVSPMPTEYENVGEYYVKFYGNHHPCPTLLYTADRRWRYLESLVDESRANGVIFLGEKFCEYEYFEIPFLEKKFRDKGIASLSLEFSIDDKEHLAAFSTRIEAFAEMLANNREDGSKEMEA